MKSTQLKYAIVSAAIVVGLSSKPNGVSAQPMTEPAHVQTRNTRERTNQIFTAIANYIRANSTDPLLKEIASTVYNSNNLEDIVSRYVQDNCATRAMSELAFSRYVASSFFLWLGSNSQLTPDRYSQYHQRVLDPTSGVLQPAQVAQTAINRPRTVSENFADGLANRGITSDPIIAAEIEGIVRLALRGTDTDRRLNTWGQESNEYDLRRSTSDENSLTLQRAIIDAVAQVRSRYTTTTHGTLFVYSFNYVSDEGSSARYEVVSNRRIDTIDQLRSAVANDASLVVRANSSPIPNREFGWMMQRADVLAAMHANTDSQHNMGWNKSQLQ